MMDIVNLMNEAFVPMVMITGVALLILGINERFSRVMDRIRNIHRDLLLGEIKNERLIISYREQIEKLLLMARILRNAMLSMYFSVFFAVVSSISILFSFLTGFSLIPVMLVSMIFSLASLFLGAIFVILHITFSLRAIEIDIKNI
ncbi:MAG: DUF2721 domain-containing protein [Thermoplasmata archaeon]|jgi:hypothetical protein|nr:DUF2721 domain-containing protein [Thermoplasmatales archaeon]